MRRKDVDMLNGPLLPSILSYTIPIILTSVLQLLFNAADLVVVGQFCGHVSVGAVSATGAITNLIINLFFGLSGGVTVTISHALGAHNHEEVHRIVHTSLPVAVVGGAILTVVGVVYAEPLLRLMSTPENTLPLAAVYMRFYFGGMVFNMVYNFCSAILRAAGDTRTPLLFLTIAGGINVVLNLFFVIVLDMNVAGVALATTISQGISAVLVIIALMRRTDACHLDLRKLRFYGKTLGRIARLGIPAGIQGSLFSISNVILQSSINSFEIDAMISGNGAAGNLEGFVYVAMNALHQTSVTFIGQNAGAHRYDRVKKVIWQCMGCVTAVGLFGGILMYGLGRPLLSFYITDSEEALAYGMIRLAYVTLPYFTFGMMDVSTGSLRGLGASLIPMSVCVLGICGIRILWIYTIFQIPQYHTLEVLYLSYPISWILTLIGQSAALFIVYRKQVRRLFPAAP